MASKAVFGIYPNLVDLQAAVKRLQVDGFRNTDVSVLLPENDGNKDLGITNSHKAPEGATAGGGAGAVVGGTLGWLAGIGALAVPGIGPLLAAGPIVAALAGVGAGGALGAVTGGLIGFGVPEYEAKRFEGRIRSGGILLSVHTDDDHWQKTAERILKETGANDVHAVSEAHADFATTRKPVPREV